MEIVKVLEGGLMIKERTYELFDDQYVVLSVFKMTGGSMMCWIGKPNDVRSTNGLTNLNLSINGNATNVMGNEDNISIVNSLAIRIGKKFNKNAPTYLSYNLKGPLYATEKYAIRLEEIVNEFLDDLDNLGKKE